MGQLHESTPPSPMGASPLVNDWGEVAFSALVKEEGNESPTAGLFLSSNGTRTKIMRAGDPSPLGGTLLGGRVTDHHGSSQWPRKISPFQGTHTMIYGRGRRSGRMRRTVAFSATEQAVQSARGPFSEEDPAFISGILARGCLLFLGSVRRGEQWQS